MLNNNFQTIITEMELDFNTMFLTSHTWLERNLPIYGLETKIIESVKWSNNVTLIWYSGDSSWII